MSSWGLDKSSLDFYLALIFSIVEGILPTIAVNIIINSLNTYQVFSAEGVSERVLTPPQHPSSPFSPYTMKVDSV